MDPAALAWALAQATTSRWRVLADAYTSGTLRVTFEGRTVEYRSLAEIERALSAGYGAETVAARRPGYTLVQFQRG